MQAGNFMNCKNDIAKKNKLLILSVLRLIKRYIDHILLLHFPFLQWLRLRARFSLKLKRTLKKQLKFHIKQPISNVGGIGKRILMPQIETSHYQYYQMFILAKALQLRGAEVKILLCGSRLDGCELKNVRNSMIKDPCLNCRFNHEYVAPMYGLDIAKLSDFISDQKVSSLQKTAAQIAEDYPQHYYYEGIDIIPMVNDSVIRFYYGAVPSDEALLIKLRKKHLLSSMIGVEVAEKIDKLFSPDVVLNNMFVYSVAEPYYQYYGKKDGTKLFSVSNTPINYYSIILNIMDPYQSSKRYLQYLKFRGNNHLTALEGVVLKEFINSRIKGEFHMFRDLNYFESNININEVLSIDRNKRNIFLFPSVYWDIGMSESGQLFNSIVDFILATIDILKEKKGMHLYIKAHPGEKYDSASSLKGIENFIYEKYSKLPENLTLILPEQKISPYDLFPYIDLGVVYNGTLGLEMLLQNIPIVITGKAPYGRLGFAHEPLTLEEYIKILSGEIPPITPDKNEVELFAYFYFIKNCIPWNLTKRAYGDNFKGYTFASLDNIMPGKNKYLDHICDCILKDKLPESW